MPLLAICRGHQVLNVALGGTLDQHITDRARLGRPRHARASTGGAACTTSTSSPGRGSPTAMGATQAECSSHHHQAVDRLGAGLRVTSPAPPTASSKAIELDGDAWVVGVQWHPEDTAATDPDQQRLFDAFVEQVRRAR